MALLIECLENIQLKAPSNETSIGSTEIALQQGVTFWLDPQRDSNWATYAVRSSLSPDTLRDTLPGFSDYQRAGGIYSERLYGSIIAGVEKLLEPGEKEKYDFKKPTLYQIMNYENRINHPFPADKPRPEEEFHITPEQILAYCLLREGHIAMPEAERQKALPSDGLLIDQILKMPALKDTHSQQHQIPLKAA